jgi:hypothetical protein
VAAGHRLAEGRRRRDRRHLLPHTKYALPAYYIVAPAEASSNLARYDGVRYGLRVPGKDMTSTCTRRPAPGFGAEVKRRIMIGTYVLSAGYYDAYYLRAQKVRTLIKRDFERPSPTGRRHPDARDARRPPSASAIEDMAADPVKMYLNDIFTVTVNMAGLPGIAVPAGKDAKGLPLGLQLIGRPFDEETLFQPRPAALEKVDGVIVLGGGFEASVNLARGGYELSASGDRFVEAAVLARRFPEAKIVVTGGQGSLVLAGDTDADTAPRLLTALGVAPRAPDPGGQVARYLRECAVHQGDGEAGSRRNVAVGDFGLPHAALGGSVSKSRLRGDAMAGRLSHDRSGELRVGAGQPDRFAGDDPACPPRMARPAGIPVVGTHGRLAALIASSIAATIPPHAFTLR